MIVVKVTYRVKSQFVGQNKDNIANFMVDFKKITGGSFRYNVYLLADGQTFVHLSHFQNEQIQQTVLNTPSFKSFQQQRDSLGLESPAQIEEMSLVASTKNPFE
jgi:hypothetical protein